MSNTDTQSNTQAQTPVTADPASTPTGPQEVKVIDKSQLATSLSLVYNAIDAATQKGVYNLDIASKIKMAFDYLTVAADSLDKCQQYVINDLNNKQNTQQSESNEKDIIV
jgi:hypothetical protein